MVTGQDEAHTRMLAGRLRPLLKWLGGALAATAAGFVVYRFWTQSSALPDGTLATAAPGLVLASLAYAACGFFLALIWWLALRAAGCRSVSASQASSVFLSSQLGKYLPGNVGHFAARHVLSRRHGVSHRTLVAATLLESLLLVIAAGTLTILTIRPMLSAGLAPMLESIWLVPVAAAIALVLGLALARRRHWLRAGPGLPRQGMELGAALGLAFSFFLASSGCFMLISSALAGDGFVLLVPWVAAAWLLGFLVPGAPGGLGIREFVLVLGLTPLIGEAQAALDALLFRLVTIGGDALMTMVGAFRLRMETAPETRQSP